MLRPFFAAKIYSLGIVRVLSMYKLIVLYWFRYIYFLSVQNHWILKYIQLTFSHLTYNAFVAFQPVKLIRNETLLQETKTNNCVHVTSLKWLSKTFNNVAFSCYYCSCKNIVKHYDDNQLYLKKSVSWQYELTALDKYKNNLKQYRIQYIQ
jgi:hypothetical protein